MCQSQAEGGKRCAAHTRPVYEAAMTLVKASRDHERVALIEANREAIANHAATPAGNDEILNDMVLLEETFTAFPSTSSEQETDRQEILAALTSARAAGKTRMEAEKASRAVVQAAAEAKPEHEFRIDTHFDVCNYCGASNVPGTMTREGYKPLPHKTRSGGDCVWGDPRRRRHGREHVQPALAERRHQPGRTESGAPARR